MSESPIQYERVNERMELVAAYPPCWDELHEAFPLMDPKTTAFTYGSKIYIPEQQTEFMGATVIQHETIHSIQQDKNPEAWWKKFISDVEFRRDQEGEAFRHQYNFFCSVKKDRNARARFLHHLAVIMSGEIYGKMCSYEEAKNIING